MAKTKKSTKKKIKKNIPIGSAFIQSSFNNTIISITDPQGNVVAWSSGGVAGFKGSRKSTPFAAQIAAEDASAKAVECGVLSADVFVTGPGAGRETALKAIGHRGIVIKRIQDLTPIPHNGCRPPKKRRM